MWFRLEPSLGSQQVVRFVAAESVRGGKYQWRVPWNLLGVGFPGRFPAVYLGF